MALPILTRSQGHIAASMDMHIDLDERKPTPIPTHKPSLLLSPVMGQCLYQFSGRAAAAVQRSTELETLAVDMSSVLSFQQEDEGGGRGSSSSSSSISSIQQWSTSTSNPPPFVHQHQSGVQLASLLSCS